MLILEVYIIDVPSPSIHVLSFTNNWSKTTFSIFKQEEIRSLFSSIGEVESCKLIRDKVTGKNSQSLVKKFQLKISNVLKSCICNIPYK